MKRLLCALAVVVVAAAPALADPNADVRAAALTFAKATSYHINADAHGRSVDVDVVPPGKMHIIAAPVEVIKIDQTTWVKLNGNWQKFALPGMDRLTGMYQGAIDTATHPPSDMTVTDLGVKTVEGTPLHAYAIRNKSGESPSTVYLDAHGMLARVDGSDGTIVRFSKFNAPLSIDPPN